MSKLDAGLVPPVFREPGDAELTYWNGVIAERDATIATLRTALERAAEALGPFDKIAHGPLYICTERGQFTKAIDADGTRRARTAFAAVNEALGREK